MARSWDPMLTILNSDALGPPFCRTKKCAEFNSSPVSTFSHFWVCGQSGFWGVKAMAPLAFTGTSAPNFENSPDVVIQRPCMRAGVGVRACGRAGVGVRVCGCAGVRVCECVVCGCVGVWVCGVWVCVLVLLSLLWHTHAASVQQNRAPCAMVKEHDRSAGRHPGHSRAQTWAGQSARPGPQKQGGDVDSNRTPSQQTPRIAVMTPAKTRLVQESWISSNFPLLDLASATSGNKR